MKTSVYITSERIEAIAYKKNPKRVYISAYASEPLSDRTMLNGNIMDMPSLVEALSALKRRSPKLFKKGVSLVIDSNLLAVKEIPVPKLKRKQYLQLVKDEFANSYSNSEQMLIDYSLIEKPDNKTALFALSSGKDFVASYLQAFRESGIELKRVNVGLESIVSYIKTRQELKDKTFIINIVDGFSMFSVVFSGGNNVFSTRTRLQAEDNSALLQSLTDNLLTLMQFAKSQKFPEIYKSYYLGLNEEQAELLDTDSGNLEVFDLLKDAVGTEKLTDPCHLSYMGIYNNNGINLLESYKNAEKNMKEYTPLSKVWIIPAVEVIAAVAVFGGLMYLTSSVNKDIDAVNRYLNDENTVREINEIDRLQGETGEMSAFINQINTLLDEKEKEPPMTKELLDLIVVTEDSVVIESFNMSKDGQVTIIGSSDTQMDSSKYAEVLLQSRLVDSVEYKGYKYDSNNRFRFSILAVLHNEKL